MRSEALLVADELLLHHLLGDRGAALHGLAFVDVAHERPQGRADVDAVMGVEVRVLDREDRVDGVLRDLAERHGLPVDLGLEGGQQGPVRGVDVGALVERAEVDHRLVRGPGAAQLLDGRHQRETDCRQADTGDGGDGREAEDERAHGGVPIRGEAGCADGIAAHPGDPGQARSSAGSGSAWTMASSCTARVRAM